MRQTSIAEFQENASQSSPPCMQPWLQCATYFWMTVVISITVSYHDKELFISLCLGLLCRAIFGAHRCVVLMAKRLDRGKVLAERHRTGLSGLKSWQRIIRRQMTLKSLRYGCMQLCTREAQSVREWRAGQSVLYLQLAWTCSCVSETTKPKRRAKNQGLSAFFMEEVCFRVCKGIR